MEGLASWTTGCLPWKAWLPGPQAGWGNQPASADPGHAFVFSGLGNRRGRSQVLVSRPSTLSIYHSPDLKIPLMVGDLQAEFRSPSHGIMCLPVISLLTSATRTSGLSTCPQHSAVTPPTTLAPARPLLHPLGPCMQVIPVHLSGLEKDKYCEF